MLMTTYRVIAGALLVCLSASQVAVAGMSAQAKPTSTTAPAKKLPAAEIDGLLAPVALYPDQLLTQMLLSATLPDRVAALDKWLKTKPPFTGTALQDAARQTGFEPSLVLLVLFPQVVEFMATNLDWTTAVGKTFSSDRAGVLDSVQRLRLDSIKAGKLKSTSQQSVSLVTATSGEKVIVIEPVNPQVVYVPQYSTQTVYTQAPASTTVVVVKEEDNDSAALAAGVIGFTAGIAIGAAMDNDYYYGPYGWHGGPHMYNDGWDDYYDDRQDAREDWYDNREDARDDIQDSREDAMESRGDRASSTQQQRTDRQETRQQSATTSSRASGTQAAAGTASAGTSRPTSTQATKRTASAGESSAEARGQTRDKAGSAAQRGGKDSDAFSNYSSGKSERSASARGKSSRSSSGGGRSRR
jgi:Protein of unknown function (DUF3300)